MKFQLQLFAILLVIFGLQMGVAAQSSKQKSKSTILNQLSDTEAVSNTYSPFRDIRCYGTKNYRCADLKRGFDLKSGDPLTDHDLEHIRRKISRLVGVISQKVAVEDDGRSSIIQIDIQEEATWTLGAALGAMSADGLTGISATGQYYSDNWLGGGEEFNFQIQNLSLSPVSEAFGNWFHALGQFKSATYAGPWFNEVEFRTFDNSVRNERNPLDDGEFNRHHVETSFAAGFGYRVWPKGESMALDDFGLGVRAIVSTTWSESLGHANLVETEEEREFNYGAYLRWNSDSRDDLFFPTKGRHIFVQVETESASKGASISPYTFTYYDERMTDSGRIWSYRIGPLRKDPFQPLTALPLSFGYGFDSKPGWVERQRWMFEVGGNYLGVISKEEYEFSFGLKANVRWQVAGFGVINAFIFGLF